MRVSGRRASHVENTGGGSVIVEAGLGAGEEQECGDSWSGGLGAGPGVARSADL